MDYIGINWNKTQFFFRITVMLAFCGQDRVLIDANGRLKLPPKLIEDFLAEGEGDIVFYCLPEGAVALYPERVFNEMRNRQPGEIREAGMSMLKRRDFRRFGAWSAAAKITPQGRLTLPAGFRETAALEPGTEAIIVGVEIGAEIWNLQRWQSELKLINEHERTRGDMELTRDLQDRE